MASSTSAPIPSEPDDDGFATFDQLVSKKARTDVVTIALPDGKGGSTDRKFQLKALSSRGYDALEAKFPPTKDQQTKGMVYDIDKFAPALISACAVRPALTVEQATALYESEEWASGEISGLFFAAQRLCNLGLDASFTAAG